MLKKIALIALASASIAVTAAPAAASTVINFDDLTGLDTVPSQYQGVTFGNNFTYYSFAQDPYNPHSGGTRIFGNYNIYGQGFVSVPVSFAANVFEGLWVSGQGEGTVSLSLYNGSNLVGSSASIVSNSTPTFLASNYSGLITSFTINAVNGFSVYDDFTFGTAAGAGAVPEPATWAMMLAGFGMIGFAARRRQSAKTTVAYA